jgi:hypothetical protein
LRVISQNLTSIVACSQIEEHQRKAHESLMIANQYRDTFKMLEKDHNCTRAGSIKNAAARVQIAQVKQKKVSNSIVVSL